MTHRVFKYPVPVEDKFTLTLPVGAKVLDVQAQHGEPQLWALVRDPWVHEHQRTFILRGTGHPIEEAADRLSYCGTFQMSRGHLVFHVFEVTNG